MNFKSIFGVHSVQLNRMTLIVNTIVNVSPNKLISHNGCELLILYKNNVIHSIVFSIEKAFATCDEK